MELAKVTDEDGNVLEVIAPSEDWDMLILRVIDENDIPVGVFLDPKSAARLRNALEAFLVSVRK